MSEGMEGMYSSKKLTERYERDPEFRTLINVIESFIHQHGYTPSELREAVFYASLRYEQLHVKPIFKDGDMFTYQDALIEKERTR